MASSVEQPGFESEMSHYYLNKVAFGEVWACFKVARSESLSEEDLLKKLKADAVKIRGALSGYSVSKYGDEYFRAYADGTNVRIQSGSHELTPEDEEEIQKVVEGLNAEKS